MNLQLSPVPRKAAIGTYGVNAHVCDDEHDHGKPGPHFEQWDLLVPGGVPDRFLWLAPEAAIAFLQLEQVLGMKVVVSDMFRDAQGSLKASLEPGRSAKPPSESGHNYGFSIDIHVEAMLALLGLKRKRELDTLFARCEWFCFWTDGREHAKEWWHFNHIPARFRDRDGGFTGDRTSGYLKRMIDLVYGEQFVLDVHGAQTALQKLHFYAGEVDGVAGKLTRRAVAGFQEQWHLDDPPGRLGAETQRLLAYLSAEKIEVPLPAELPPLPSRSLPS